MSLPKLSQSWAVGDLIKTLFEWGRQIEAADKKNIKSGSNIELPNGTALIVTDTTTGDRVQITVDSGALTLTTL